MEIDDYLSYGRLFKKEYLLKIFTYLFTIFCFRDKLFILEIKNDYLIKMITCPPLCEKLFSQRNRNSFSLLSRELKVLISTGQGRSNSRWWWSAFARGAAAQ